MRIQIEGRAIQANNLALGMQGENNVEIIEFIVSKADKSEDFLTGMPLLAFKSVGSGMPETVKLTKEEEGENLILRWVVGNQATRTPGMLSVQIEMANAVSMIWRTNVVYFTVGKSIVPDSPQEPTQKSRARIAVPELEPAIIVAERKIIVPSVLQALAVQNDTNSESVRVEIPRYFDGHDLSQYSVTMRTVSSGGEDNLTFILHTGLDLVWFNWTLKPPQTSYAGTLEIQIFFTGQDFAWHTEIGTVTISKSLNAEPIIPVEPDLFDQFLSNMSGIETRSKASETNAAKSAESAADSAKKADVSEKAAASSAANAKVSEVNAKKSETSAADSEVNIDTGLKSKLSIAEANQLIKSVAIDDETGIFTFTKYDGTALVIDTGLEKVVLNMRIDPDTLELILVLADGTEQRVSLVSFLNLYTGGDTSTVSVKVNGTIIQASVKGNSVGLNLLTPELQEIINNKVTANQPGNASQIRYADNMTMQQKLDAGLLNGKDGVTVAIDGFFHMYVDDDGNLFVEVADGGEQPPLSLDEDGNLYWEIK